jgi:Ser/Thr protein kinase RdoA (MazF antagonist)
MCDSFIFAWYFMLIYGSIVDICIGCLPKMMPSFPAISSVLSPEALIHEVLPGFGLDTVTECKFYSGGFNHTYRVKTNGGHSYYLRAYRKPWRNPGDIRYELDVLNHLKRKGYPAASPVPYEDGQFFCKVRAPEGDRYLVVFTEAPGHEISYEHHPEQMASFYGQAVARMHNALEDFSSPNPRFHLDVAHFIDQPLHNIEPFLVDRLDDWAYVQQFARSLRDRLMQLPDSNLEQGFCHGDLQGYHAKIDAEKTLTFFDFDCGGYGYRTYDLAVFLWCCRLEDAVAVRWEPFLDAYRQTRSISDLDVKAVPLFACARYLWHIGVHTQNSPDWGIDFLNDEYFATHLKRLREAQADYLE